MNTPGHTAWQSYSRGFWTKRKKSATSLLAVMAMLAGIAVAFKLFDQTVPNNVVRDASIFDYEVFKLDEDAGDTDWEQATLTQPVFEGNVDTYPGSSRTVPVKIFNTNTNPARNASFQVHVTNITVEKCADFDTTPGTSSGDFDPVTGACLGGFVAETVVADANRFINFWTLSVDKQAYLNGPGAEVSQDDHPQNHLQPDGDPDDANFRQYTSACEGGVRELTAAAPCDLGVIRAAGSQDDLGEATDVRYYEFSLSEADDGSDQSKFRGYRLIYTLVFNARLPALAESSTFTSRP